MNNCKICAVLSSPSSFFGETSYQVLFSEYLVKKAFYISLVSVINRTENYSFVRQKLLGKLQSGIKHGKKIVTSDRIIIICFCEFTHIVFAIRRIYVDDINFTLVLNEEVLQRFVVVSDNEFVSRFRVISVKTQLIIFFEITNITRHLFEPLVKMKPRPFIGSAEFRNHHCLIVAISLSYELDKQIGIRAL